MMPSLIDSATISPCPICASQMKAAFSARVLSKYDASYVYCESCGFLQTHNPTWLDEAYSSAIASTDTGLVMRNLDVSRKLASILYGVFGERGQGRYVDMAGGYGMLTRMMRDSGFDFYWSDKYCQNLLALGFEYESHPGECVAVTAIEIMEHLEDPMGFVQEALQRTNAQAFLFTTELYSGLLPPPEEWEYYSFETGQHIAFFQRRTLEVMASKINMHFASAGGVHIFSRQKIDALRLKICTGKTRHLIAKLARRSMGSKMMADHAQMVQRLRHG